MGIIYMTIKQLLLIISIFTTQLKHHLFINILLNTFKRIFLKGILQILKVKANYQ